MRTLLLAAAALLLGISVRAQNTTLDKFCEKHKDASLVTLAMNGTAVLNSMVHDNPGKDDFLKKVKNVRVLVFEEGRGPASIEWNDLSAGLHHDNFEDFLSVRKGKEGIAVLSADLKGGLKELVFIGHGGGGFVLDITGSFNDKDMSIIRLSMEDEAKKEEESR